MPWLGAVSLGASALLYSLLLGTVRRMDRAYPSTNPTESTWWFGYVRDLMNFAGAAGYTLSFAVMGFPWHLALLAGFALMLITYGLDYAIARGLSTRRAELLLAGLLIVATIPIFALRRDLETQLRGLVDRLF